MINFVVILSDPYVLDTQLKRGAELSTDHKLDPLVGEEVGQTWYTHTYCEGLLEVEPSVNSHLQENLTQIPREGGDFEVKWTMLSASIVDTAVWSCTMSLVPVVPAIPVPGVGQQKGGHQAEGVLSVHVGL